MDASARGWRLKAQEMWRQPRLAPHTLIAPIHSSGTGFPKKRRPFLEIENVPCPLGDDREGKLIGKMEIFHLMKSF